VGDTDDDRARASLSAMMSLLALGPHEALGLPDDASPAEVRAAFLELTKVYHPAKFSRRSADVQGLSNEVFLGLRAAHDALAKQAPAAAPAARNQRSTDMPQMHASGTGPLRATRADASGSLPQPPQAPPNPATQPPTQRLGTALRAAAGASQSGAIPRPQPPPTVQAWKPAAKSDPNVARPPTPQPTHPPATAPQRPPTPQPAPTTGRVATQPIGPRAPTPATGVRTTQPVPTLNNRAPSPPAAPSTTTPPAPRPATASEDFDERAQQITVRELMRNGHWPQAVVALQTLATRVPASKQYRAMLCYARGRQAQLAGRVDDAIAEMQRALQIDPEWSAAKSALAELVAKRR
jgi:hypothetical protein